MIELATFGATELRRDGTDVRSVLSQPRRLALLVWLRVAAAGGFVARERVLGLFWPESDQEKARNALRQSLHFLRRSLGERAIISRADHEIGVDPGLVACDAVAFRDAIAAGRLEEAIGLYRGEFLAGFYQDDAPDVERWIEEQRAELGREAVRVAWALSEREDAGGDPGVAVLWARRAVALDPMGEAGVRRLMELIARTGERAGALEVYQELERRLAADLELEPSPETTRVAERIRRAVPPAAPPVAASSPPEAPTLTSGPASDPPVEAGTAAGPTGSASGSPPSPAGSAKASGRASRVGNDAAQPTDLNASLYRSLSDPAEPGEARPPRVSSSGPASGAAQPALPATPRRRASDRRRRLYSFAAAAVLVLAAGWTGVSILLRNPARSATTDGPPAIAVLPFVNMSAAAGNDYFSDGVTEELLNVLASVPGLRVAARTSSFAFRGKDVGVDSIARALNVSHVVEGSVRGTGDRVRITAQLIEAKSGYHIWSETYDRDITDIFAVQDEISAAIAKKLQIELAGNLWGLSARETKDPEAYRLLLRAMQTFRTPSAENYATSATLLEDALRRDPGYARAYGALANVLLWQGVTGWSQPDRAYERADSLAHRGLAIAETPEIHLALARLAEVRDWSPDSADAHFTRALALNPSDPRTLQYHALFLARSSRGDQAIAEARRATELDPLHPGAWTNFASVLSMLSREDEALAAMERARSVAPNDVLVLLNLANQYANVGRMDDALATSGQALQLDSTNITLIGLRIHLLFQAGRTAEARAGLEALEKRPEFPRFRLAALYANTQDIDRILDLLEASAARREGELTQIRSPEMFRGLREHPRFRKLLEALESRAS